MKFKPITPSLGLGITLTLLAYLLFAISSAFVGICKTLPTIQIVFFQNFIPLILTLPKIFSNKFSSLKPVAIFPHAIRDIFGIVSFFSYFLAIKYIGLVDATVLTYTAPFYIPLIWYIWTKEKVTSEVWWTILLGFIGIIFILRPGSGIFDINSLVGIFAGITSALALAAISFLNKKQEKTSNTLFYNFLVGTLIALPFMFFYWKTPTYPQWGLLLGVGLTAYFGQKLLTEAYRHGTASFLTPLSYSIVIYTALISWFFFKQPPAHSSLLGILFIICGGSLSFILRKKPKNITEVFQKNESMTDTPPWWHLWNKTPKKH